MSIINEKSTKLPNETAFTLEDIAVENADPEKIGTTTDHRDMLRMGKAQQFKVCIISNGELSNADV